MSPFAAAGLPSVFLALLLAGCTGKAPRAAPAKPAAGAPSGTGSFAVVQVGGARKLYLPQHSPVSAHPAIAVVDVSATSDGGRDVSSLLGRIDLSGGAGDDVDYATTTAGDSTLVIAASTESATIWFIDPTTDALLGQTKLDASYGQSTFGGNGGFVTSIAMDSAHGRAILAVWNGFAFVDLASRRVTRVIPAPPSENFAFDPVHQRIVAPFYDCASSLDSRGNTPAACAAPHAPDGSPMTDGLSVIELADDVVYTFQDPDAPDAAAPVGTSPGSAAIDPTTELAVIPSKDARSQTIVDFSRAVFDRDARVVTAPSRVLRGNGLTDVAIAPRDHLAFWEGEDASDIAAALVPTLSPEPATLVDAAASDAGGAAEPDYVFGRMPPLPDGTPWMNVMSSHGVAVWPGDAPFGVTVSHDYRWVARVDLHAFLGLPASYHEVSDVSSAVTLFDTAP